MATFQELVVPSKDVDHYINVTGMPIKIDTATRLGRVLAQTLESIYAISHSDSIAVADANANYSLSVSLQSGEYNVILNAINALLPAGTPLYPSFLQLPPFTYTMAWHLKNMNPPFTVAISFLNCRVSEDSEDFSANDTQTVVNLSMQGTGIKRDVFEI